mmetsp:Transcript_15011/g.38073  ORF Transcript_15011/g.38073 Transcript_15011/m.38073 type:complete len:301 (-) Transcript_15011:61-963(-)
MHDHLVHLQQPQMGHRGQLGGGDREGACPVQRRLLRLDLGARPRRRLRERLGVAGDNRLPLQEDRPVLAGQGTTWDFHGRRPGLGRGDAPGAWGHQPDPEVFGDGLHAGGARQVRGGLSAQDPNLRLLRIRVYPVPPHLHGADAGGEDVPVRLRAHRYPGSPHVRFHPAGGQVRALHQRRLRHQLHRRELARGPVGLRWQAAIGDDLAPVGRAAHGPLPPPPATNGLAVVGPRALQVLRAEGQRCALHRLRGCVERGIRDGQGHRGAWDRHATRMRKRAPRAGARLRVPRHPGEGGSLRG